MNTELLRNWLNLPPGAWPPDDRTILALANGPATATHIEECALAQMEKLRPYQLVDPDLVTEGMNRLAQALIALTDEANRTLAPVAAPQQIDREISFEVAESVDAPSLPTIAPLVLPVIYEAEIVRKPKRAPKSERKPTTVELVETDAPEPTVEIPEPHLIPAGAAYVPTDRRKAYAELVALRKVIQAWEKLQPQFASPSEKLHTSAMVLGFFESVAECRHAVTVHGNTEWFEDHGGLVLTIVRNPMALSVFRMFVRSQRRELAADWANAAADLRGRYLGMRQTLQTTKPRHKFGTMLRETQIWMRENPEWLLTTVVLFTFAIGLARTMVR